MPFFHEKENIKHELNCFPRFKPSKFIDLFCGLQPMWQIRGPATKTKISKKKLFQKHAKKGE